MPEGHSIHRLAIAFTELSKLGIVRASSPQGRFSEGAAALDNAKITRPWAWGKHLFLDFDIPQPATLHVHLGLYGSWKFQAGQGIVLPGHIGAPRMPGEHPGDTYKHFSGQFQPSLPGENVRLRLEFSRAVADLSGPNQCELLDNEGVKKILSRLGPDPLVDSCSSQDFIERARKTTRGIGQVVMDQSFIAGPGNIYRAECLFRCGINPNRQAAKVSVKRLQALWEDLRSQMTRGLKEGLICTTDDPSQGRFWVYQRSGEPCRRCGTTIRDRVLAGRRSYWCPKCQK